MKYYLKLDCQKEYTEITKEEYIRAERQGGFHSKIEGEIATAGFSSGSVQGKVEYEKGD